MEAALVAAGRFMADKVAILVELDEKLKAIIGIKGKMEKLKDLSTNIDAVIEDVESRPLNDVAVTVKDLLRKIEFLARDLEDVVDYYDTKVLQKKQRSNTSLRPVRDFFSSKNQLVFKCKIGSMIKAITDSLDSILQQKSLLLNLPQGNSRTSPTVYRETHSRNSLVVIGREAEKQMIVDMLTKDDDDADAESSAHGTLKVITIVGMGGLGKTTLAQLVFNDERVKAHFASSTMWTVVGAEFDPAKIMKSVLQLATEAPVNISQIDLVRKNIEKTLSEKRFLLVLDDVWSEDQLKWNVLKAALTCGARGSKILVTTRNQQVSSIMGSSKTHQLQQLSKNDCVSLFQQFAFGDKIVDQNLMEIGVKIVEKCGGVPLAAISLGSMLHGTRDETYWSSLLKSKIWKLEDSEKNVLVVLKLSYDTLSLRSKKCFAFGSLYPRNSTMKKDELIKLWIANGFLQSEGDFDAETIGNRVFDELVYKSFFLSASSMKAELAFEDAFTMHDLLHDLARSVSGDAYWNAKEDLAKDIGKRTYHLQHTDNYFENLSNITGASGKKSLCLRTLILNYVSLNADQLEFVFSELKFLRVLDLSSNNIRKVPRSIGNLIHLRYLSLSWNDIEVLPDSITLLLNLQHLNLSFNEGLRELPKDLGNMQSLRDLDCRRNGLFSSESDLTLTHMPRGLSRLTNLRSLPLFIADGKIGACSIIELQDLKLRGEMKIQFSKDFTNYSCGGRQILKDKKLNELCIEFNGSERYDKDMLDDLYPNTSLKKLSISDYRSRQFPAWLMESQLPNLVEVHLENCIDCTHIPPFGNLQFLKKLVLEFMIGITHLGADFHGYRGFPSLQELSLYWMDNLEEWSESRDDVQLFPSLQRLWIQCPILESMPRLARIEELEILNCSRSLLSCIGRQTSLSVLRLRSMTDMVSLPTGCIRNLTSLTELKITDCSQLQSLPGDEIQHIHSLTIKTCPTIILQSQQLVQILNSVHQFNIQKCGNRIPSHLHGQLQYLRTLKQLYLCGGLDHMVLYEIPRLTIYGSDELESLMTAEQANSMLLETLFIDELSNLTTLPEWLQHLKSLCVLCIRQCPRLQSMPKDLKNLYMLETLRIMGCPQLEKRCQRETGEDWSIISHVPNVYIRSPDEVR